MSYSQNLGECQKPSNEPSRTGQQFWKKRFQGINPKRLLWQDVSNDSESAVQELIKLYQTAAFSTSDFDGWHPAYKIGDLSSCCRLGSSFRRFLAQQTASGPAWGSGWQLGFEFCSKKGGVQKVIGISMEITLRTLRNWESAISNPVWQWQVRKIDTGIEG